MENTALENGTGILPTKKRKLERTSSEKFRIWFFQNRFNVVGALAAVTQISAIYLVKFEPVNLDFSNEVYEEVAFVNNLQVVQDAPSAPQVTAEGEIVPTEKLEKPKEDNRVAQAVNPYQINATMPVDLTPTLKPLYTAEARAAGIEGIVYIELVIADTGEVLSASPRGKTLGYGLEAEAIRVFRRKKFSPAKKDGEPITVKIVVPVRFTLN